MNFSKLLRTTVLSTALASSLSACVTLNDVSGNVTGSVTLDEQGNPTGEIGANLEFKLNGNQVIKKQETETSVSPPPVQSQKHQNETQLKQKIEGPIWFEEAMKWIGTTEVKGSGKSNSLIETMHNYTKNAFGLSDAAAWCASFTNWILKTTADKYNLPYQYKGTGSAGARHFFSPERYSASKADRRYSGWGQKVSVGDLAVGDLATIIWDTNTNKGHVGFVVGTYLSESDSIEGVWILGGNQRNQQNTSEAVTVSLYKLDEAALFEFKRVEGFKPKTKHSAKAYTEEEMQVIFGENVGKRGSLVNSR